MAALELVKVSGLRGVVAIQVLRSSISGRFLGGLQLQEPPCLQVVQPSLQHHLRCHVAAGDVYGWAEHLRPM